MSIKFYLCFEFKKYIFKIIIIPYYHFTFYSSLYYINKTQKTIVKIQFFLTEVTEALAQATIIERLNMHVHNYIHDACMSHLVP